MPAETPLISAIVCTTRPQALASCLASLRGQMPKGHAEILVVDNSLDGPISALGDVRVILSTPPGLSRARNRGVAEARASIVAFIDDDAEAQPGWMEAIVAAFAAHPEAAVAGGPVVPIWPGARPAWLDPSLDSFFSVVDRGSTARALTQDEWLAGTNVAFRRPALIEAGGFDERLGRGPGTLLGNEEIAVLATLAAAGHSIRYDPAIIVCHHVHTERVTRAWLRRRVVWQAISDLLVAAGGDEPSALWGRIAACLAPQPAHFRNLVGLTRDLDAAGTCRQVDALQALVRLLASSGESLETVILGTE